MQRSKQYEVNELWSIEDKINVVEKFIITSNCNGCVQNAYIMDHFRAELDTEYLKPLSPSSDFLRLNQRVLTLYRPSQTGI